MPAALLRSDARALPLADDSVDLIVTSPPYFALRSYQDDGEHYDGQIGSEDTPAHFLAALWQVMDECWRVLKPSGSVFVNLGDKFAGSGGGNQSGVLSHRNAAHSAVHEMMAARNMPRRYNQASDVRPKSRMLLPHRFAEGCIDPDYRAWQESRIDLPAGPARQWVCRMDQVWDKPNGMPESVTDRVRVSHEYWFHLTKEERYYANLDAIREGYSERVEDRQSYANRADVPLSKDRGDRGDGNPSRGILGFGHRGLNPLGKLPGSVWSIPSEPLTVPDWLGVDHYAAFPTEWPRRLILGWSPSDGRVLDPFGGTGTTAMIARALGRHGINIDLSADYLRLARWRIHDSGHWDKAVERTTGRRCDTPTQIHGQMSLL